VWNDRLTTHLLQTQSVRYFQDAELAREVSFAIEASYEQLGSISKTLTTAEKVEAAYVAKSMNSLSNFGSLGRVERAFFPAPLSERAQEAKKDLDSSIKASAAAETIDRGAAAEILDNSAAWLESDQPVMFRSGLDLDDGKCLAFTGRCIEDQIAERVRAGLPALTPDMSGWLTIYAVDVDADSLRRQFKSR